MRICMVGTGRMAASHSASLRAIPGVVLDTVVGSTLDKAAAFAHEQGYAHAEGELAAALGRSSLDAVAITTPNALHFEQTVAALAADKHVLCEIPLAMSLQETQEIGRLARQVGRSVMVCHTERFELGRIELARRIRAGELHPLHVIARFYMLRRGTLQTSAARTPWQDNLLWHHGCHTVDGVLSLLGETEAVNLQAQHGRPWPGLEIPIDWDLQWRTPSGVPVSVTLSHNAHQGLHDYRLLCEEETIVCDHGTLSNGQGVILDARGERGHVRRQDEEFIEALRTGRPPQVDVAAALPTMAILQAAWDVWQGSE